MANLTLTDKELAEHLGRSWYGIKKLRERCGIIKKRWITEEERQFVRDHIHLSNSKLSQLLNRSAGAVREIKRGL